MAKYDFTAMPNRRGTSCAKWDGEWMKKDPEMLPLWVADMDFEVLPEIKEALARKVDHGVYGYHFTPDSYLESVKNWMSRRHGWNIETSWIVPAPGIVPAINAAVNVFTKPDDHILIFSPVYYPFSKAVEDNDRRLVRFPLTLKDGRYSIDFEALEKTIEKDDVKMIIFCSPHNPIGRVWTKQELQSLAEICQKHHVVVIDDEIHMDLTFEGHIHIPFLKAAPQMKDLTIVCTAPSKTFNIAGLQVSALIIPDENLRKTFEKKAHAMGLTSPGIMGMTASEAAYNHGDEWLDELLMYLKGNKEYIQDYLKAELPMVEMIEPEGLYLVWLDFRKLGLNHKELEELMLKEAHVWLDEGYIFGPGGEGFERINIAAPRSVIEEAMLRITRAVRHVTK